MLQNNFPDSIFHEDSEYGFKPDATILLIIIFITINFFKNNLFEIDFKYLYNMSLKIDV